MDAAAEPLESRRSGPVELRIPELTDEAVGELVRQMNRRGVAVVPDYLRPEDLSQLKGFVSAAVQRAGGEYVVFNGKEAVGGTVLAALAESSAFTSLIRRLWEGGTGRPAPAQRVHQVLRCLAGETGRGQAYIFHFDSYVLSLLLPILIPERGRRGDLVMAPNVRKIRRFYVQNLIDKLIVDNRLTQFVLRQWLLWRRGGFQRIAMVPGSLYLFWGYRSLHTNEPCDAENIRSTALYHFGDPHAASPLRRRMGRVMV